MAEENSVKQSIDSSFKATGKVLNFVGKNVILPMITAGTSLATQLPKAARVLNFLSSSGRKEGEKKDNNKVFIVIGIAVFFLLPIMAAATITAGFMDFIGLKQLNIPQKTIVNVIKAPLQCQKTRHPAEKVICWFKEGVKSNPGDCPGPIEEITISNWETVKKCLYASSLTNKEVILNHFEESVNLTGDYAGKLQCVGFVKAVENSIGHRLESCGNAKDFGTVNCPAGYVKISVNDAFDLKPGNLVVRNTTTYGHIGIVVEVKSKVKIVVAQAWGNTGQIFLSNDAISNYQVFLEYK